MNMILNLEIMKKIIKLLYKGLQLFFILPLCLCSKKVFNYYWNKYYTEPLELSIFNLCIQWLLYTGKQLDLDYESINVLIFCIIWPIITILSIALNVILIIT